MYAPITKALIETPNDEREQALHKFEKRILLSTQKIPVIQTRKTLQFNEKVLQMCTIGRLHEQLHGQTTKNNFSSHFQKVA